MTGVTGVIVGYLVGTLWPGFMSASNPGPLFMMLVFSLFFGRLAKVPSDGIPYPIFTFCALLPWQLFASALTESSNSLVGNQNLITKVYFPRLIVPMATVVVAFVDFLISFFILVLLMGWYHFQPDWRILVLPIFVLLAFFASVGPALWITLAGSRMPPKSW